MRTMTGSIFAAGIRHRRVVVPVVLLLILAALSFRPAPVRAEDNADAITPVEEFSRQLEDFQKSVPDLNKSIQESAGAIDAVTDIDKARADIENCASRYPIARRGVGQWPGITARDQGARSHPRQARDAAQEQRFSPRKGSS